MSHDASITFTLGRTATGACVREATFRGTIRDADVLDGYARLIAEPGYDPSCHDLIDLLGVEEFDLAKDTLRILASRFAPIDALGLRTRTAIVATQSVLYGLARMYEMLRDGAPEEIHVFQSREEAMAWITAADLR